MATLVHTTLDSLVRQLGPPGICLIPRAPISFIVAYLTNVGTVRVSEYRLNMKTLTLREFAC